MPSKTWIDPLINPEKSVIITSWYVMSEFVTSNSASIIFENLEAAKTLLESIENNPKITYTSVRNYKDN